MRLKNDPFVMFFAKIVAAALLFTPLCVFAQTGFLRYQNTSLIQQNDVLFSNPAMMAFHQTAQFAAGVSYPFSALSGDLRRQMGTVVLPASDFTFGARFWLLDTPHLQQGVYGINLARIFARGRLALSLGLNNLSNSFNPENADLIDADDPLITFSTSKNAFSANAGMLAELLPELYIGFTVNHANRPNIAIGKDVFERSRETSFGVGYDRAFHPRLDFLILEGDRRTQFAFSRALLRGQAALGGGFSKWDVGGGGWFVKARYQRRSVGLEYLFFSGTGDLALLGGAGHRFSFTFGRGVLARSEITFPELDHAPNKTVFENTYLFSARVRHEKEVKKVEFYLNGRKHLAKTSLEQDSLLTLRLPLVEGKNKIEVRAFDGKRWKTRKAFVVYEKKPDLFPEITLNRPADSIAYAPGAGFELKFRVKGVAHKDLKRISVLLNDSIRANLSVRMKDSTWVPVSRDTVAAGNRGLSPPEARVLDFIAHTSAYPGEHRLTISASNDYGPDSMQVDLFFAPPNMSKLRYRKLWALIIGIDDYKKVAGLDDLKAAVSDADTVRKVLQNRYAFDEIIHLENEKATLKNIEDALAFIEQNSRPEDGVLVFFAGHGVRKGDIGDLVPFDGSAQVASNSNNLDVTRLKNFSKLCAAEHVFFVIDACYSGLIVGKRGRDSRDSGIEFWQYLEGLRQSPARNVITAGSADQLAADGLFTEVFVSGLSGAADVNRDGFITFSEIGAYTKERVGKHPRNTEQTPLTDKMAYERTRSSGEFVFEKWRKFIKQAAENEPR